VRPRLRPTLRPRPSDLASRPHGPRGLNIPVCRRNCGLTVEHLFRNPLPGRLDVTAAHPAHAPYVYTPIVILRDSTNQLNVGPVRSLLLTAELTEEGKRTVRLPNFFANRRQYETKSPRQTASRSEKIIPPRPVTHGRTGGQPENLMHSAKT